MKSIGEKIMSKVTIGATGDFSLHRPLLRGIALEDNSGYNFDEALDEAKQLFSPQHLTVINLETVIGGEEIETKKRTNLASPTDFCSFAKNNNIDLINLGNNHIMDRGEEALIKSLNIWDQVGIPYVGANKSISDQETMRIFYKNGIKICFLSYSLKEGLNKRPKERPYLANLYKDLGKKGLKKNIIDRIRNEGLADVIILSIHFGKEFHMMPNSEQHDIVRDISEAGADIILGHHTNVLQPPTILTNSQGRDTFVAYSLGNFFSGHRGLYRQIGGYMSIDVEKPDNSYGFPLKLSNPSMKLTYVDTSDNKDYKLQLLEDLVRDQDTIITDIGEFDSKEVYEKVIKHMTQWLPNLNIS